MLATPNLNGDYLSDAAAAQVGGLGMAPGANVGEEVAVLAGAIRNQTVTYDLERQMQGATLVSTSRFGEEIVRNMA